MDFWYSNTLHLPFSSVLLSQGCLWIQYYQSQLLDYEVQWNSLEWHWVDQHLAKYLAPHDMGALMECHQVSLGKKVSLVLSRFLRFLLYSTGCGQVVFLYHSGWFPLAALSNPYIFTILKIRQCPGSLVKVLFLPLLSIPKVDPGIFIESWLQQCLCHRQFWFEPSSHYT